MLANGPAVSFSAKRPLNKIYSNGYQGFTEPTYKYHSQPTTISTMLALCMPF